MATCPNKSHPDWKKLVDTEGEDIAYYLWDKYDGNVQLSYQLEEIPMSPASQVTLGKVKQAAKKMGIDIQSLSTYLKGNPEVQARGVNALADITRKIVAVAENKEDVALTEEVVHVATAILEQTNPRLVTEMIAKIGKFKIYNAVYETYKNNPNYQTFDGKPDIRKIKKEAVDKLIAEVIINESEGSTEFPELMDEVNRSEVRSWWQKILDWFRSLYKKSDIDIFEKAAERIVGANVGEYADLEGGIFLQLSEKQERIQRRILDTKAMIRKVVSTEPTDPMFMDTEEANNWYEMVATGERILKRVTDRVKQWYRQRFPDKDFTKEEKELNEFKRQHGIKGHSYLEEIHGRYYNSDGTRRATPGDRSNITDPVDAAIYQKLENYFVDLMTKYTKNGKQPLIFSEVMIYDNLQKEAGTIDLMIVEEDGKVHILDWKFLAVGKDYSDIPWFKQEAYNIQLSRYRDILMKNYGAKSFGMVRAIPILFNIKYKDPRVTGSVHKLTGIKIGSLDTTEIEELVLMPVSEERESVETLLEGSEGFEKIDSLIAKLNSVIAQISKKTATDEEERELKIEKLNAIRIAIRHIQGSGNLSPLIKVISLMRKEGEMIINDWKTMYKDKPSNYNEVDNKELSEFAARLRDYRAIAGVFRTIDRDLGKFIYSPSMEESDEYDEDDLRERKDALEKIRNQADLINDSYDDIVKISKTFADKFVGLRNLVSGLLSPNAIIKGLATTFRGVSDLPLPSLKILFKLVINAKAKATQDALAEVNELMELRKRLMDRGGNVRELVNKIYQSVEGKHVNKLIYKYKKKFYDDMKDNALEGHRSKQWLYDNVDINAYKIDANELLEKRIERIKSLYEGDPDLIDDLVLQEKRKWDITRDDFSGWNNYLLKRHPLEKWESDEYKEIKRDEDLFALYNFIHRMNEKAVDAGYISNRVASTFLPFVRKGMAESLAWDFSLSAVENWSKELTLRAGDVGYGQINELTSEYEYAIPKYYTYDISSEDGSYDNVSEDIFKNMILYINHMEKYKYLSDIEGQLQLVKTIETFKKHLNTAKNGDVVHKPNGGIEEQEGNEENTRMFDVFLRAMLYDQKYPLSSGDTPLGKGAVANYIKKSINKVAGREVFKEDENPSATSLMKSIDAINRAFQLKTLGFEVISGAANLFGTNIQVATQAGNYFLASEFFKNETTLIGNRFRSNEEREMFIQLNDLFMPMKDDPVYERLKKAGISRLTRGNFSDAIMIFMRVPELHVEKSIFITLLQNMMVENGKIVSIREHVKKKYADRYKSSLRYRESKRMIDNEIEELKKTRSIYSTKKLENGKLVIPGLDLSNRDEIQRLTNLTRRISRNATGGLSDSDLNNMALNVWTKSMMVFKNWIPKLIDTRFGEFRPVNDDFSVEVVDDELTTGEKYDIGRVRLFFGLLGSSIKDKGNHILNILQMNDKGIVTLNNMYEEYSVKYENRTGKPLTMSREDFIDMIKINLSNQVRELTILLSFISASFALGLIGPDDEKDRATKNLHRYSQRVFDRFIQELSFFYNPMEFQKMLSGSMFPAIGLISDVMRATDHVIMQITGYDLSNHQLTAEEVREKAQPIKNISRMFPGTKAALTYGAVLSDKFAEEFDITIQKESRR